MRWIVTGANRGIGLELAKQLTARGEEVIATARDPQAATELVSLGGRVVPLDVRDADSVASFVQALGDEPVDVLINNAGVGGGDALGNVDYDFAQRAFDTNALGTIRVVEAVLPKLKRSAVKKVANISSRMGSIEETTGGSYYAYRMSKAALNMATRCMAIDLKSDGVAVVSMHPGWVQTDMGGPNAEITTEESATAMLETIAGLSADQNGTLIDRDGAVIPW